MTSETQQTPQLIEYRVALALNIHLQTTNNFRLTVSQILQQQNFGALTVLFSSQGGSTDESLSLFNFIASLPVQVHMHAVGHVGSAAVPVFLAGHRRTCAPLSRFFFHEYDWTFTVPQTLKRMNEAVQRLRSDIELARNILKSRTKATDSILKALDGSAEPTVLTADQAQSLGFVDEVLELQETGRNGMKVCMVTVA